MKLEANGANERRDSNTRIPPQVSSPRFPLVRPQNVAFLVEDRRLDPLFFSYFIVFFQVNACSG